MLRNGLQDVNWTAVSGIAKYASLSSQKKKNNYIFSSHLRADQMPGPPREVQLTICLKQLLSKF